MAVPLEVYRAGGEWVVSILEPWRGDLEVFPQSAYLTWIIWSGPRDSNSRLGRAPPGRDRSHGDGLTDFYPQLSVPAIPLDLLFSRLTAPRKSWW